jgi:hypothetical protein
MRNPDFHNRLIAYYNSNRTKDASRLLMSELGSILIKSKKDFVDLLNESDIIAYDTMSDNQLVDLYVSNLDRNKKLRLGTALLINMHNKQIGFDGDEEVSNDGVKVSAIVLDDYYGAEGTMDSSEDYDAPTIGGTMSSSEEDYSYVPGVAQAIAGAVQGVATLGTKISEGQQKKKYGSLDIATKKQDAKAQMTQQILAQRLAETENKKKEDEQKQKTTRTILIVGGVLVGLTLIGMGIYFLRKKNQAK